MKMLKPLLGPHEWPSILARSPTLPTRSTPPLLGAGVAGALCAPGTAVPAPAGVGGAAGFRGVLGAGALHATARPALAVASSRPRARRRLMRVRSNVMCNPPF